MKLIVHLEDPGHDEEDPRFILLMARNCEERLARGMAQYLCKHECEFQYYAVRTTIVLPDDYPVDTSKYEGNFDSLAELMEHYPSLFEDFNE